MTVILEAFALLALAALCVYAWDELFGILGAAPRNKDDA